MKKMLQTLIGIICPLLLCSCGNGRTEAENKAYTDSLFNVVSSSPTIVAGRYTLEDQLEACDLLIKEYPNKKDEFIAIKDIIKKQINERDKNVEF